MSKEIFSRGNQSAKHYNKLIAMSPGMPVNKSNENHPDMAMVGLNSD